MKTRVSLLLLVTGFLLSGSPVWAADFSGEHHVEVQRKHYEETGTTTYEAFVKLWPSDGRRIETATFITPYGYEDPFEFYIGPGGSPSYSRVSVVYEFSNFTDLSQTIVPGYYTVLLDYTSGESETLGFHVPSYSAGDFPAYVYPTNISHGDVGVSLLPTFQMGSQDWSWMEGYETVYDTPLFDDDSGASEVTVELSGGSYLEAGTLHSTVFNQNEAQGDVFIGSAYVFDFTTGSTFPALVTQPTVGSISPAEVSVPAHGSQMFVATVPSGYKVEHWLVDGEISGVGQTTLSMNNIISAISVSVSVVLDQVYPDLIISNVSYAAGTYSVGDTISVTASEINQGDAVAPPTFTIQSVLAPSKMWGTPSNILLFEEEEDEGLGVGEEYPVTVLATIPNNVPEGSYYVGIKIDVNGEIDEGNEGNNIWWSDSADVVIQESLRIVISVLGEGGSVSPSGEQTVDIDDSLVITADPDGGYKFKHWLVNGAITDKGQKTLTLNNITSDMTVEAVFEKIKAMPWLNLLLD